MNINYKKLHPATKTPEYKTLGSAAFDFALIEDVTIEPNTFKKVRTGLVISTPENFVLLITSRSSNPTKKGINLANNVGVIDSDYCGPNDEIFILLQNITNKTVTLKAGDRIAQGIFIPISQVSFTEITKITKKNRGGFGSTGM